MNLTEVKNNRPLKAVVIGGGKAAKAILDLVASRKLKVFSLEILAVVDPKQDAPGVAYADKHWWPTLTDVEEAINLPGLEVVVELTGDEDVTKSLYRKVPQGVHVIDHLAARLFWDIFETDRELAKEYHEKQKLQQRIEADRKNLQDILDSLPYVVMVVNPQLQINRSNARFGQVSGTNPEDAVGKYCFQAFCGKLDRDEVPEEECPCRQAMKTGERVVITKTRKVDEDTTRYYEITASPIKNEAGEVVEVVETSQEITTLKQMIQTSEEQQRLFEDFIRTASEFISIKDTSGHYLVINPSFAAFWGKEPNDFMGKTDADVLDGDIARMMAYGDEQVLQAETELCYTDTFLYHEEERTLLTTRFPLRSYEGNITGLCTISRDVTEERRLQNKLLQTERLAAVGRAIGGLAHDIKNILNGFQGGMYVLDFGLEMEEFEEIKKGKRMVERNINRISDMIRNMLAYSKDRKPSLEFVNPTELLQDLYENMSATLDDEQVTFEADIEETDIKIEMDATQLYRVLMNLVSNAVDACNEKMFDEEEEDAKVIIRSRFTEEKHPRFAIEIVDNGIGMSEKVKRQMFEGFFSTKGSRGTGFGMPVSQKLVQEMGGAMEVDSAFGQGTTMRVLLPVKEQPDETI